MSTFRAEVVPVELTPHPNAERLSIVRVFGYDVCVRTEDWLGKDRGVYVPVDAMVPVTRPEFAFLADPQKFDQTWARIKAKRLRGVFSMGFLLPLPPLGEFVQADGVHVLCTEADHAIGADWTEPLGIVKYEEPEVVARPGRGGFQVEGAHDRAEPPSGGTVKYTDIEHIRRHDGVFAEGEIVLIHEKIHGANARYTYRDGAVHIGSRNQWKRPDESSAWYRALTVPMARLVAECAPVQLCGEVYGKGVQDLAYGTAEPRFVAFDAWDPESERYLDYQDFRSLCLDYRVPVAPLLYMGAWRLDLVRELAERESVVAGNGQISEGVVVRPYFERHDHRVGRVILKWPGERYLTRAEHAA